MESMGTDREEAHSRHAHTHHIATTASSWNYAYEERATTPSTLTKNVTAGCMLIGAQWSSTPAELIEVEVTHTTVTHTTTSTEAVPTFYSLTTNYCSGVCPVLRLAGC